METSQLQSQNELTEKSAGKLFIIGLGPGHADMLTDEAKQAIDESEIIVGNDFYLDQIPKHIEGKEIIRSSMGKEVDRAKRCIELASEKRVAMVSGGDPGVYGMASIVLEVLEHSDIKVPVKVVPGVTAATAGASLLGSPLSGDFCVISLSDLLTPWEVIEKRLNAVFSVKIPVVLYNPKSRTRTEQLGEALLIAEKYLNPDTPVGIVKNAFRDEQEIYVTTLSEMQGMEDLVDMHSVVFIGGEESRIWRMKDEIKGIITPRGYHRKYVY